MGRSLHVTELSACFLATRTQSRRALVNVFRQSLVIVALPGDVSDLARDKIDDQFLVAMEILRKPRDYHGSAETLVAVKVDFRLAPGSCIADQTVGSLALTFCTRSSAAAQVRQNI